MSFYSVIFTCFKAILWAGLDTLASHFWPQDRMFNIPCLPAVAGVRPNVVGTRPDTRTLHSVLMVSMETTDRHRERSERCPNESLLLNIRISPLTFFFNDIDI